MTDYEQYSVDQLIDAATELNDRTDALFTTLAGIEHTATGEGALAGVCATVNLEGRLTRLTLSPQAMALPPDELAAEIFRLTRQAAAAALAEGLDALAPVAGEEVTTWLTDLIEARPKPHIPDTAPTRPAREPVTLDESEDFSVVRSWALPR